MVKNKFWPIVGATFLMYMIMSIFQNIVAFIPYIIGLGFFFTTIDDGNKVDPESSITFIGILVAVILILSVIFGYLLNSILIVSQGMMYYSARENDENKEVFQNIDLIGKNAE
jgi:predicted membrane protein